MTKISHNPIGKHCRLKGFNNLYCCVENKQTISIYLNYQIHVFEPKLISSLYYPNLTSPNWCATNKNLEPILTLIKKVDKGNTEAALLILEKNKNIARFAVPALISILQYALPYKQIAAVTLLGLIRPVTKEVINALIMLFNDSFHLVFYASIHALAKIGIQAIPALKKALKVEYELTRAGAALALGAMGESAKSSVDDLARVVENYRPHAHLLLIGGNNICDLEAATRALAQIGRASISKLVRFLKSRDSSIRLYSAIALGKISPPAKEAISPLKMLIINEKDKLVRKIANRSLNKILKKCHIR